MAEIGKIGGFTCLLDDSFIFERLNILDYPQFVTKTIQLLGANSGLRLIFANDLIESKYNPKTKTINIPPPPPFPVKKRGEREDRLKERMKPFYDQLAEWRGVLNHEVGHAQFTLWHSDIGKKGPVKHSKINPDKKTYPAKNHAFVDLFENGRMERVACDKYPGMIKDLQRLETVLQRIIKEVHKKDKKFNHLYYAMRMAVNGYNPVIAIPKKLKKDWEVCLGFVKEAWGTKNEHETILIAIKTQEYLEKRMKEIIEEAKKRREEKEKRKEELEKKKEELEKKKEELEKEEEKEDEENEDEEKNELGEHDDKKDEDGENGEDEDGEEIDDGEMGEEKYDNEGGEIEVNSDGEINSEAEGGGDGDGVSVPNLSDDDPEDPGESEGDCENEMETDEGTEEVSEEKGQGDAEKLEGEREEGEKGESEKERIEREIAELEDEEKEIEKELEELDKEDKASPDPDHIDTKEIEIIDVIKAFDEILKSSGFDLSYRSTARTDVIPMPLNDYVKNIDVMPRESTKKTQKLLDKIMGTVSGMAQRFIQKVRSSRHVATRTYKGRISNRNLHKYQTSKNIFKTENIRIKKGASVMIIVDCSASMGGHKIATARKAALVMGEIMYQAKVEFEVVGFTIPFSQQFDFHAFTRKAKLTHYHFGSNKDWDFRKHGVVESEKGLKLSDNDDGESLRQFASELAKSKKEQKMMVVISDGEPCSSAQGGNESKDLHTAIAEIRKEKIEIYAIGLDTNVGEFYGEKNSVRISSSCSTEELVNALAQFIGLIGN